LRSHGTKQGLNERTDDDGSDTTGTELVSGWRDTGVAPKVEKETRAMNRYTALTVPTRFVEANGIRFAYRRWGRPGGLPLVFLNYFTGNLDDWDPLVTDGFAADHDVVLFDSAGVGSSGGQTPGTALEMARHAVAFCDALGLNEFHVVGFSLGGMIAQQLALDHPRRVNRLILLGTGPRGGEGMEFAELSADERADPEKFLLAALFAPSAASQAAGRAYLKRLAARTRDRDQTVSPRTAEAQLRAIREWGTVPAVNRYAALKNIEHPALVAHGNKDIVVLPINALVLAEHLPNAQLIVYPDSNHAPHSQHAELFLKHAKLFLSA
jgi:pimeloyl-ACP methyl ester carboxylesterase